MELLRKATNERLIAIVGVLCVCFALSNAQFYNIYLQPGNSALPVWDGSCTGSNCLQTSPCQPNVTNTASPQCLGIYFMPGSLLSGFAITSGGYNYGMIYSTLDSTTTTGPQDVYLGGYAPVLSNFVLTLNGAGRFLTDYNGASSYPYNYQLIYESGPGATFNGAYCMSGCVLNTSASAVGPFPVNITGQLQFYASTITNVNMTSFKYLNAVGNPTFLTIDRSSISNSILGGYISSFTLNSNAFITNTLIGSPSFLGSITSSLTNYINTTFEGPVSSATFAQVNVWLPPSGSTPFLAPTSAVPATISMNTVNVYSSTGVNITNSITLFNGAVSVVNLNGVNSPLINWGSILVSYTFSASYLNITGYINVSSTAAGVTVTFQSVDFLCSTSPCMSLYSVGTGVTMTIQAYSSNWIGNHACSIEFAGSGFNNQIYAIDKICANAGLNASISGGTMFITQAIASGGALSISAYGLTFNTITIANIPELALPYSILNYQPTNLSIPIVSYAPVITGVTAPVITWPVGAGTVPPVLGYKYPFIQSLASGATTSITSLSSSWRNVTYSVTGNESYFTFSPIKCNGNCVQAHLNGTSPSTDLCGDSLYCPCQLPWGGPHCDCDTTYLPPNAICSTSGGPYYVISSPETISVPVYIPPGYTLSAPTLTFTSSVVFNQSIFLGSSVNTQTVFNGSLTIYSTPPPPSYGSTPCVQTYSTALSNPSANWLFNNGSSVNVYLNVSNLNHSCIDNPYYVLPLIQGMNVIGVNPSIPFEVFVIDPSPDLNFTFPLIGSNVGFNTINLTTPEPYFSGLFTCQSVKNSGIISITISNSSIPCGTLNPPTNAMAPPPTAPTAAPTAPTAAPTSAPSAPTSTPSPVSAPTTPAPTSSTPTPTSSAPISSSSAFLLAAFLALSSLLF